MLTTLVSRKALTLIQRLKDLGISSDLISETLNQIVSQKLVRRLCHNHQLEKSAETAVAPVIIGEPHFMKF